MVQNMNSNTQESLPEWLTDDVIADLRNDLAVCANPYTQEEVEQLELDAPRDMARYNAYFAKKVLSAYNLI